MVRISGRFLLIIFFIHFGLFSVNLRLLDMEGKGIESVGISEPFILEFSSGESDQGDLKPKIQGIENFAVKELGLTRKVNFKNNIATVNNQYRYLINIDKEGNYSIGPAEIVSNGKKLTSNIVKINVSAKKETLKKEFFLQISLNKKKVFIGEKVNFRLTFYTSNDSIDLKKVSDPDFTDFNFEKFEKPKQGSKKIGDKIYNYIEWSCNIFPKKSGIIAISPVKALYEETKDAESIMDFGFGFSSFFKGIPHEKILYSNSLKLEVSSLPPYKDEVDAVGSFYKFNIFLNQKTAKEGEGVVLTLELEGEGDMKNLNISNLKMPDALKYYESKSKLESSSRKVFEFIVQGLKEGSWQIPSQKFVFFDTKEKRYKSLKTKPIDLKIIKNSGALSIKENNIEIDELRPLQLNQVDFKEELLIPWKIFTFIILFLLGILSVLSIYRYKQYRRKKYALSYRSKNALKVFQKGLKEAEAANNCSLLYLLVMEFFSAKLKIPRQLISCEFIINKLQKLGLRDHSINSWKLFFNKIEACYFYSDTGGKELFQEANRLISSFINLKV